MTSVLLVDDEPLVVDEMAEVLEDAGLGVCALTDPYDALQRAVDPAIRVVVTDLRMPGLGGEGLIALLGAIRPDLRFVVVTGHSSPAEICEFETPVRTALLQKPVAAAALIDAVREALT